MPRAPAAIDQTQQLTLLANILKRPVAELSSIRLGAQYHYRTQYIPKANGTSRRLDVPNASLKKLQHCLLANSLSKLPCSSSALGFRPNLSNLSHALTHAHAQWVATVDVQDFFPSTQAKRVKHFYYQQGWRGPALAILMNLTTLAGGLPQGAPTSPCLSNLVNFELDYTLGQMATGLGAQYTRYADDLAFSWSNALDIVYLQRRTEELLIECGYRVNRQKGWQIKRLEERPQITGIVLLGGGQVRVPWALRWQEWRRRWRFFWTGDERALAQAEGYRAYRRHIERPGQAAPYLYNWYHAQDNADWRPFKGMTDVHEAENEDVPF